MGENKQYKVKLIMSDVYIVEANNKKEAEDFAREQFGNNYLIDDVIVEDVD